MINFEPRPTDPDILEGSDKPGVAIIREEGSNGDREMASAFYMAGFDVWDITMTDLMEGRFDLETVNGVAFVGGFSYADVLDSAKGWAGLVRLNPELWKKFQRFRKRNDTFSLGICNGCQLMALLGWIPWEEIPDEKQPRFVCNSSGRFESRFVSVKIFDSPSIMLRDMEDSVLGIWVAHGEGRAHFPDADMLDQVDGDSLAPVRFVDDYNEVTEVYPHNPNGSPRGIAAICSKDGRHLAIMPHPERCFLKWQWPWMPDDMRQNLQASPWLRLFQNARKWVQKNR
jgi:phosphoribosylformylglycinamidine synthase